MVRMHGPGSPSLASKKQGRGVMEKSLEMELVATRCYFMALEVIRGHRGKLRDAVWLSSSFPVLLETIAPWIRFVQYDS